jgi:hypothetical protein
MTQPVGIVRFVGHNGGGAAMDLANSLNKAIEIVKLNGSVAAEVGRDEQSLQPGLLFIAISGLAAGVSSLFHHGGFGGLVAAPIAAIVGYFIGVGILHLVATVFFGAKGDFMALLRAESHAAVIGWAGIVPFIGGILGLWHLPVTVVILQSVYGMPRDKAIATVAVIVGFFLLLGLALVLFFGALLGGLFGMGGMH